MPETSTSTPATVTVPTSTPSGQHLEVGHPSKVAWSVEDVAAGLGISVRALSNLRRADATFPQPRLVGTLPRWNPAVIAAWVTDGSSDQTRAHASAPESATAPADTGDGTGQTAAPSGTGKAGAIRRTTAAERRRTPAARHTTARDRADIDDPRAAPTPQAGGARGQIKKELHHV